MAEYRLTEKPPLGVDPIAVEGGEAGEVTGLAIVWIATPSGGDERLSTSVSSAYGIALPAIGQSARSQDGEHLFLGLQPGQFFVLFKGGGKAPPDNVRERIGETASLTDQSDGWALVRVGGPRSREALERICPIDLDPDAFAVGAVARTLMEHLGVIILREDENTFLLMSARSSARSFWHMIETSIRNIT